MVGCSNWSSADGSMRISASSREMMPSAAMSTAMRMAEFRVRLPVRVCSIHSLPSSMVNSMSCMSRKCCSSLSADCHAVAQRRPALHFQATILRIRSRCGLFRSGFAACAGRQPHPRLAHWAKIRRRGLSRRLKGSRVKATPVAESAPRLPNTMAWTVTAVPQSSGILCRRRKVTARTFFQRLKTARMAAQSWTAGLAEKARQALLRSLL